MQTGPRKQKEILNPEEVNRILCGCMTDPADLFLDVHLELGGRKSEIRGLTWNCICEADGVVKIAWQLDGDDISGWGTLKGTKTHRIRKIHPAETLFNKLKQWRICQCTWRKEAGSSWLDTQDGGLIFTDKTGAPIRESVLRKRFRELLRGCAHADAPLGIMRRSAVTYAYFNTGIMSSAVELTGHTHLHNTLLYYIVVEGRRRSQHAEQTDQYFRSIRNRFI